MMRYTITLILLATLFAGFSQVPGTLSYQGILVTTSGAPYSDGNHTVKFRFYDALTGGTLLHETALLPVTTYKGMFSITIGTGEIGNAALTLDRNNTAYLGNRQVYVEISADGTAMSPRVPLTTLTNALHAHNANTVPASGITGTANLPNTVLDPDVQDLANDGVLSMVRGGTGATTPLTGVLVGDGTTTTGLAAAAADQYLRRNAANTAYEFSSLTFPTANTTTTGLLSSTDWNTFNSKLTSAGSGLSLTAAEVKLGGTLSATTVINSSPSNYHLKLSGGGGLGVGLDATDPQSKLDVSGNVAIGAAYAGVSAGPANGMIIEGPVGIGTTAPDEMLNVVGSISIGTSNTVGGTMAHAIGESNDVNGHRSIAIGTGNTVAGQRSLALGHNVNAPSSGGVGIGDYDGGSSQALVVGANQFAARFGNGFSFYTNSDDVSDPYGIFFKNGRVGIATNSPTADLHFSNDDKKRKIVLAQDGDGNHEFSGFGFDNGVLNYQVSNSAIDHVFYSGVDATTSKELLRIGGIGNVGVGTGTLTGRRLAVEINTSDASTPTGLHVTNGYNSTADKYGIDVNVTSEGSGAKHGVNSLVTGLAGDASNVYGLKSTVTPNGSGSAYGLRSEVAAAGTGVRYGLLSSVSQAATATSTIYGLHITVAPGLGSAYGVYVTGDQKNRFDGSVGIGQEANTYKLEVNGSAGKTSGTAWINTSDRRIKEQIAPIAEAREKLMRLRPVRYKYTPEWRQRHNTLNDGYYYSFIAQEYREVFPESVVESGEYVAEGGDPVLAIDIHNAHMVTIKTVQELVTEVEQLQAQVAHLQQQLNQYQTLSSELEQIRKALASAAANTNDSDR